MYFYFEMKTSCLALICLILCLLTTTTNATHLVGGSLTYQCLNASTGQYRVTQKLYRDCSATVVTGFDEEIWIFTINPITENVLNGVGGGSPTNKFLMPMVGFPTLVPININDPCMDIPNVCVEEAIYQTVVTLSVPPSGLMLLYQRCCRNDAIINISLAGDTGTSYTVTVPPSSVAFCNNAATFDNFPPIIICANMPLNFDHSATDIDGDELVYSLCSPLTGATNSSPIVTVASGLTALVPVNFIPPYSATNMLGGSPAISINSSTGLLTANPSTIGKFVVGVCIAEYRAGELISEGRRDIQFNVADCQPQLVAAVPSQVFNCSNNTVTFDNNSYGEIPITDYIWNFGDPTTTTDVSYVAEPTYIYPDTGIYNVMLIVNPGITCADTGYCQVNIFPLLTPNFTVVESCVNFPYTLTDASTTTHGTINSWNWDYGDGNTGTGPTTTHIYTTTGTFNVTLTVTNTAGCTATITTPLTINLNNNIYLSPDTTFCLFDGVQLQANGGVLYNWLPTTNLSNPSISNPLCTATTTTTYTVEVTNSFGCNNTANITVTPISTIDITMDSALTACVGDTVALRGYTSSPIQNSLAYTWTPTTLNTNNPTNCIVPPNTTTYTLTANLGSCTGSGTQTINAIPLPTISISPNQRICENQTAIITATGGETYLWSPSTTVDIPTSASTLASPLLSTTYNCTINITGVCTRTIQLSTDITVVPYSIALGNDTVIYKGQSLPLNAGSSQSYYWYPPKLFTDPEKANPIYTPTQSGYVVLTGISPENCVSIDSMYVKVIEPNIIAPNAFSPNGDGINDVFMLISKDYTFQTFNIYNRWGEKVFATTTTTQGWDGTFKDQPASQGVYVFYATYYNELEQPKVLKGNVTLLR